MSALFADASAWLRHRLGQTFASLGEFNYRLWALGALVSNIGTWMQRTAQDWLVLTELTHHSATAVGIVMSLQFGPQMLLTPLAGMAADRLDRRKLLMATQSAAALLALALGLLSMTGWVRLWQVYLFAGLLGCVTAFDGPARHSFVSELASEQRLSNAVALNSLSFNSARLIGPALAGVMIAAIGTGWVFVVNAVSFVAVLASLGALRVPQLYRKPRDPRQSSGFVDGLHYVAGRPDLLVMMAMMFLFSTFGLNFPIFIATMSVGVFHAGAQQYGYLSSTMAIGSVTGALLAAGRSQPRIALLVCSAAAFALVFAVAILWPHYLVFALCLTLLGVCAQTFNTACNSAMQLASAPAMRGRVMAMHLAIMLGGTPLGAPFAGWVADRFGPRCGLLVGMSAGVTAALVGLRYLIRYRGLRLERRDGRWRLHVQAAAPGTAA
ncbi:MFS transporter [Paludibacterium sp. B53371]|uniref:MFS transporter n=1 Tax=Paludibacterium sp. B53371 TaxID=2806263 RepID=UPI001C044D9A|nr:MFS transporter [Paludibacterium sp. B53371]